MALGTEAKVFIAVFIAAIFYRTFWALTVSTSFVPDEYYQTIEPAYNLIYGDATSQFRNTWEWRENYRIRSYVPLFPYLLLFKFKYSLRHHWGISFPEHFVDKAPRFITGLLISSSDILFFSIVRRISNSNRIAAVILFVHLFSWSASYCLSRTLINSTETALLIIGIYFWSLDDDSGFRALLGRKKIIAAMGSPENYITEATRGNASVNKYKVIADTDETGSNIKHSSVFLLSKSITKKQGQPITGHTWNHHIAISIIAVTVHSRPTAILFWAPLLLFGVWNHRSPINYILSCIATGLIVLICCIIFDSICYGHFTVTPLNFFHINVTNNYAALFYGAKSWHWNFSHNLPVMCGLYSPFLIFGLLFTPQPRCAIILELLAILYIILMRCITAHQEYRFILPCLPFLHIAVGYNVWRIILWCIPSLEESEEYSSCTALSFCRSIFLPHKVIDRSSIVASTNFNALPSIVTKVTMDVATPEITISDENVTEKKEKIEKSSMKSTGVLSKIQHKTAENKKLTYMTAFVKFFSLLLIGGIFLTHFFAALYLSTRHQRGTESSFYKLAQFINKEHSQAFPVSSLSPSCVVTVLVLTTCHSFPGPSSLSLLIERSGCTINLYSPDCSPSTATSTYTSLSSSATTAVAPNIHSDPSIFNEHTNPEDSYQYMENENEKLSQNGQCDIARTPSTESKLFESSPINFIHENNNFWIEWGMKADFILTFDSYLVSLNQTLVDRGFMEVFKCNKRNILKLMCIYNSRQNKFIHMYAILICSHQL